jgi:dipeptidyl aminopeptidase/acylaminoacyl peptidase
MTTNTRTEARLPEILEELYLGRTPDYRDEVLAIAVRTRQRPWWTFPGRWLPMADIVSRSAYAPRLPWRAITVAFLIGALFLAATVAYLGSRQPRVPLPFGLAHNGQIVYASDGDIWTTDPLTGVATAVVTDPAQDSAPMFSPDGTRIAFEREVSIDGGDGTAIVVAHADGSNPIEISRRLASQALVVIDWAPDSRSIIAMRTDSPEILVLDATRLTEPRVVATKADLYPRPFQPPDGDAILINRTIDGHASMIRLDLATGSETVIATDDHGVIADARWSPDGSMVVFSSPPATDLASRRLFVVNSDGTGARQVTSAPGTWWDIAPTWSPDGSRIAFLPYERIATQPDEWDVRPIKVYTLADDSVTAVGPMPREIRAEHPAPGDQFASAGEGWSLDWAPDGKSLIAFPTEGTGHAVVIDAATGEATVIDAVVAPISASQAWQRTAP